MECVGAFAIIVDDNRRVQSQPDNVTSAFIAPLARTAAAPRPPAAPTFLGIRSPAESLGNVPVSLRPFTPNRDTARGAETTLNSSRRSARLHRQSPSVRPAAAGGDKVPYQLLFRVSNATAAWGPSA